MYKDGLRGFFTLPPPVAVALSDNTRESEIERETSSGIEPGPQDRSFGGKK